MEVKDILFFVGTILVLIMFIVYWFFSADSINLSFDKNYNFSKDNSTNSMQFYENMRFKENKISYLIDDSCSLSKKNEMEQAFRIIENKTVLEFYSSTNPEISISCEDKNKMKEGLFIAGEGGPDKIVISDKFNVILSGQILLIKESNCYQPEIAIHELLHVLGFNHSSNSDNIMYPIAKCGQVISEDIINEINGLYAFESLPDLYFDKIDANFNNRVLNLNLSVKNGGLKDSNNSNLVIYADEEKIKTLNLGDMKIGGGKMVELENLIIQKIAFDQIKIKIETLELELEKNNNEFILTK